MWRRALPHTLIGLFTTVAFHGVALYAITIQGSHRDMFVAAWLIPLVLCAIVAFLITRGADTDERFIAAWAAVLWCVPVIVLAIVLPLFGTMTDSGAGLLDRIGSGIALFILLVPAFWAVVGPVFWGASLTGSLSPGPRLAALGMPAIAIFLMYPFVWATGDLTPVIGIVRDDGSVILGENAVFREGTVLAVSSTLGFLVSALLITVAVGLLSVGARRYILP